MTFSGDARELAIETFHDMLADLNALAPAWLLLPQFVSCVGYCGVEPDQDRPPVRHANVVGVGDQVRDGHRIGLEPGSFFNFTAHEGA